MNNKKKIIGYILLLLSFIFLIRMVYTTIYSSITEFIDSREYNLKDYIITEELKPAFNKNNISVAFASDNNYVKYLSVAIVSLTDNMSKDYNYDIVILEDNIKDKNKRLLLKQIKDFKNISLRFIDINKYFDKNNKVNFYLSGNLSKATYNRLFIPDIFKNYNKVIYLDCDILINSDLVDLYKIDLGGNLIGGVRDMPFGSWLPIDFWKDKEFDIYIQSYLGINSLDEYVNAGLIVYNIKNCLDNNFTSSCLNSLKILKQPERHDQDVINMACKDKIKYLDYRYNFFAYYLDNVPDIKKYIPEYILNDVKIIHFAGYHPWGNTYSDSVCKWIETSFKSPFFSNKTKQLLKSKVKLLRYKICGKLYRSEKRREKYKEKIKNVEKRIEFIKGIDK